MKLKIQKLGEEATEVLSLRAHIKRRVGFALSRFSDQLGSMYVRLDDVNGPRGGVDKRCRVHVRGKAIGELVVEKTDIEWGAAIDQALTLMVRSVARALERARWDNGQRLYGRDRRRRIA